MDSQDAEHGGELTKSRSGRWVLNGIELTAGSVFQILLDGHWIDVRVEHEMGGYYALPRTIRLHRGLRARFPAEWGE